MPGTGTALVALDSSTFTTPFRFTSQGMRGKNTAGKRQGFLPGLNATANTLHVGWYISSSIPEARKIKQHFVELSNTYITNLKNIKDITFSTSSLLHGTTKVFDEWHSKKGNGRLLWKYNSKMRKNYGFFEPRKMAISIGHRVS